MAFQLPWTHTAALLVTFGSLACGGANDAFARYVECSEQMRTGDTAAIEAARTCFAEEQYNQVLALPDPPYFLASSRARNLELLGSRPHDGGEGLALQVVGRLDDMPTALEVHMIEVDGTWRINAESLDVKVGALVSDDGTSLPRFEVKEDGAVVLTAASGVWVDAGSHAGYPTLMVEPYFEGPEIQIDNLSAETASLTQITEASSDVLASNNNIVGVRYRTADGPAYMRGGEITIDQVADGRMSGTLRFQVEPGAAGVIRTVSVEVSFSDLPVGTK